ncbi:hypothetical protein DFH11DRAFT_1688459 [Phellopilus nigrolimitatus]|nr:hypothetical protein DFH11DRAFT_1688459 [Phellopilus nigrolimitatus]
MDCATDELDIVPRWEPSVREHSQDWVVSTHYFASYARWRTSSRTKSRTEPASDESLAPTKLVAVVNRYIPRSKSPRSPEEGGLTLVLAHWLGGHKECWEPTIRHLLHLDKETVSSRLISEIWSFEPLHHGDAALLNKDGLVGPDPMHYPTDLVEFIRRRMPEKWNPSQTLSPLLPRHEILFRPNVIGIGHSIGGTSFIHAALQMPNALSSLILIEPFLVSPEKNLHKAYEVVSAGTARQPDVFKSR